MGDLVIKENELKQLDALLGEIPMKHGMPLVNFLNQVAQLRANEINQAAAQIPNEKGTSRSPISYVGKLDEKEKEHAEEGTFEQEA